MYLGIDFLITPETRLYVVEVNVGLPGGAHEYNLTHLVRHGSPSDIFERIEETSHNLYGKSFSDTLHALPFVPSLKELKIWMDGMGPFPQTFHPGLRLEDKWIQYQVLRSLVPMPETTLLDPDDLTSAELFLQGRERVVLKRRVGRGGRGFHILTGCDALRKLLPVPHPLLLQEFIESRVLRYSLSIRAIAFAGKFMCMFANVSRRSHSNHGILTFVSPGPKFGLQDHPFRTRTFDQRSWEAQVWFGDQDPAYLRHNLYEEEVAETALVLPEAVYQQIQELSVRIERHYETLNLSTLPKACFEP